MMNNPSLNKTQTSNKKGVAEGVCFLFVCSIGRR